MPPQFGCYKVFTLYYVTNVQSLLDTCNVTSYNKDMIKSFKHKGLEKFFLTGSKKGIQAIHADKLSRILAVLDKMTVINDLSSPAYRLHQLTGDLAGQWAVTVQANWRITFEFDENTGNVYIVDYQDYH